MDQLAPESSNSLTPPDLGRAVYDGDDGQPSQGTKARQAAFAESVGVLERSSLTDFHFLLSAEGAILSESPGVKSLLGYDPGELAGRSAFDLFHPSETVQAKDFFARVTATTGLPVNGELRIRHKLGLWLSTDCAASNLLEHPEVRAIALSCRDVTERALEQEALQASESQYRALFENAPDGILMQDAAGTCLNANTGLCQILGCTREELIGMNAGQILVGPVAPEDTRERQLRRRDGSSFTAEVITARIANNNSIQIIRDISGRIHAERTEAMRNAVSRMLSDAESLAAATPALIRAICEAEVFEFGAVWQIDATAGVLRCLDTWHAPDFDGSALAARTRSTAFRIGEALPGRVWASGEMHFVPDVLLDDRLVLGAVAAAAGLRSALAFPIFVASEVVGVVHFAAREIRQPDAQLIAMFLAISRKVGLFIQRERAEKALRAGEERFRTLANSIPQLAWIADAEGAIEWYNDLWYEYTGTTLLQMKGWGWQAVHHPAMLPLVMERWKAAIATGEPFEMEFPLRGADGKFRTFLTRVRPLRDKDGRVVQWFGTNTDVNELKQVEESLRAAQVRLNSTLAAGSIGTWSWDIQKDRLTADEFTASMFTIEPGAAAKGVPGAVWIQSIKEEDQAGVSAALAHSLGSGAHYDAEYRVRQKDGGIRWVQAKGRVEKDAAGEALFFHGAVIDITERKRNEGRFRRLVDSNAQGVVFWNRTGIIEANDAFLRMVGYTREDLEAGGINWSGMTAPGYEVVDRRASEELAASGICTPFEKEYSRKDGSRVPVLLGAAVFEDNGDEGVSFVLDISGRKDADRALQESEEHFRFLHDLYEATRDLNDPEQILAVTAGMMGRQLRVSRCTYANFDPEGDGYTIPFDYTDGCASMAGSYRLSMFGTGVAATLRTGQPLILRDVQAELPSEDGAEMYASIGVEAAVVCGLVKDGVLRASMAVHQTTPRDWKPGEIAIVQEVVERCWATIERRVAEESMRQLNAQLELRVAERTADLEAANKELEAFSYSVSHDLRTPLRAVDGFSQAVMEDYGELLPEQGQHYLQTIRRGTRQMAALIDDLLEFARLGRRTVNRCAVDTDEMVRDVLADLSSQREGRQIEIRTGSLPPCQADSALLKQVWINLLSNAFKYTRGREQAQVEIGHRREQNEDVYFVRDNGTGFDMRYAHKLFGVFQRLHRAEEFEGTGVGLAIVQRVIERHAGRVWAEAAVGRGATFFFTLKGRSIE